MMPCENFLKNDKPNRLRLSRFKVTRDIPIILGYLLLAVILTYPVALHLWTHVPIFQETSGWATDERDPWHSLWLLWYTHYSLVEQGQLPFSTDLLFYPKGADLMYLSFIILPLLLSLPLISLVGLIAAYNLLILFSLAAAGYGTFLFVNYLTGDRRAAFVAGLVFAFSPFHMVRSLEQLFMVMSAVWLPFYALFLCRALRQALTRDLLLAPVLFLMSVLSNPYYAMFLLLFTGIYVLVHLWRPDRLMPRRDLLKRSILLMGLSAAGVLPLLALVMLREWPGLLVYRHFSETVALSADLVAFFVPSPYHPLWGGLVKSLYLRFTGNLFEQTVYVGYMTLALSILAIAKNRSGETRFWWFSAVTFFVLALGPFLHIMGCFFYLVDGVPLTFPLPSLLLHFVPVLGAARAPSRYAVMLMLCLAVLAGYGVRCVLAWVSSAKRRPWVETGAFAAVSLALLVDFLSVPFPLVDARIPKLYEEIARNGRQEGTLVDLPVSSSLAKLQYYQKAHRKPLLTGFSPRAHPSLVEYGDVFPLMHVLKNPATLLNLERPLERDDALRLIDYFNLDVIVLHRNYLPSDLAESFKRFLQDTFPVQRIVEKGEMVALWLGGDGGHRRAWRPVDYRWDFDALQPPHFVSEGWSWSERWEELAVAWSNARASRLWVFFPRHEDIIMDLRVFPMSIAGASPQAIEIYLNQHLLEEIVLEPGAWHSHTLTLPQTYVTAGMNCISFVYRYTARPAEVVVGSDDARLLAVAFDFIRFRVE